MVTVENGGRVTITNSNLKVGEIATAKDYEIR